MPSPSAQPSLAKLWKQAAPPGVTDLAWPCSAGGWSVPWCPGLWLEFASRLPEALGSERAGARALSQTCSETHPGDLLARGRRGHLLPSSHEKSRQLFVFHNGKGFVKAGRPVGTWRVSLPLGCGKSHQMFRSDCLPKKKERCFLAQSLGSCPSLFVDVCLAFTLSIQTRTCPF